MVILAYICAFLNPIAHAGCSLIDSHISNNLFKRYTTIVFYASLTNCIVIPFLFLFGMPRLISWNMAFWIFIVGMIEVLYQLPYYAALRKIDASIIAALFFLGKIFLPVIAYLIVDEKLSPTQYIGFFVIVLMSILLNIVHVKKIKINAAFWLMALVSVVLTLQIVLYKYVIDETDWISAIFYQILFSEAVTISFLFFKKMRVDIMQSFKTYKSKLKMFLGNEAAFQAGHVAGVFSLAYLPVAIVEGIGATQPIFVLAFGYILAKMFGNRLKESVNRYDIIKKLICFIMLIAGVILVVGFS